MFSFIFHFLYYNISVKTYVPYCYSKTLFEIDPSFFKKMNCEYLICDLDNTLDSHKAKVPTKRTIDFIENLKSFGIKVVVVSNNRKKRVDLYCEILGIDYIYRAFKPFTKVTRNFLKEHKIEPKNCMMVGDQLMTDIKCANKIGIKSILTDNLVIEDQLVTKFNKIFDKPRRDYLRKHNLLINWREIYGRIK